MLTPPAAAAAASGWAQRLVAEVAHPDAATDALLRQNMVCACACLGVVRGGKWGESVLVLHTAGVWLADVGAARAQDGCHRHTNE